VLLLSSIILTSKYTTHHPHTITMCVKSHRYLCLQTFLIIILVVCLLVFSTIIVMDLGLFLLTASANTVQNDSTSPSSPSVAVPPTASLADDRLLVDPSTNVTVKLPARLVDDQVDVDNDEEDETMADYLIRQIVSWKEECPLVNSTIQSGQLLQLCDTADPYSSDRELVHCFREYSTGDCPHLFRFTQFAFSKFITFTACLFYTISISVQ